MEVTEQKLDPERETIWLPDYYELFMRSLHSCHTIAGLGVQFNEMKNIRIKELRNDREIDEWAGKKNHLKGCRSVLPREL